MKIFLCFALSALTCMTSAVSAETNPTDNSPVSLAVTSKFIQDKLNEVGAVNYEVLMRNITHNADYAYKTSITTSGVIASPQKCSIYSNSRVEVNDKVVHDGKDEPVILLINVSKVLVMPEFKNISRFTEASGRAEMAIATNPENVFAVVFSMNGDGDASKDAFFLFKDEVTANQVAEALKEAIKICSDRPLVSKNRAIKLRKTK